MSKLSLRDLSVKDKKVLMRVDFNVPLDEKQNITDDTRITATLPSICNVLDRGGALILMSHLGRPKGKRVQEMSLAPCAKRLSQLLSKEVLFASDCVGPDVEQKVNTLKSGQILLVENLRFHRAEEHPEEDPIFAQQLASLGDVYVNDAFGAAHRAHASIVPVAKAFPGKAAAGFLLEKEIRFLGDLLMHPKRPFYAIIGGSKISTKCGVIRMLMEKADAVLLGGGMTYTFMKAQGLPIGNSICEDDFLDRARELIALSNQGKGRLLLPKDIVIATELKEGAPHHVIKCAEGIPDGYEGVDIGPDTVQAYAAELRVASTVLWNGPVGVFEVSEFARGTNAIAHILSQIKATSIVGGGDSIAAVRAAGVADKMTHLSTGGGASLEYIEFGTLPGIEVLTDVVQR
ncbi:MAG: phosphoglycerate kinase [Parachlamydiaceae bacterium]